MEDSAACGLDEESHKVILFYRYVEVDNVGQVVENSLAILANKLLLGRLLVASEGFNGTLWGAHAQLTEFMEYMESLYGTFDWKISACRNPPFPSLSVREVKEIVSTGPAKALIAEQVEFDETSFGGLSGGGVHLDPLEFHNQLKSRDPAKSLLIDVRNEFESAVGSFRGSIPLNTVTYSQTWSALDDIIRERCVDPTTTPVYMFCTGGIRCEKASAYLKLKGVEKVFQLRGGICRYQEAKFDDSQFLGKNFNFDARATLSQDGNGDSAEVTVGTCLQCQKPHDEYSGRVCCTVCRQPALFCPSCQEMNPHPGEFHCTRHRWLKDLYFTVLERHNDKDLVWQLDELSRLWRELLPLKARGKNKRRTVENQKRKIEKELARREGLKPGVAQNPRGSLWGFWQG